MNILHIVDTLEIGGAERVAVNLANGLAGGGHRVWLCTTRRDGPLGAWLSAAVGRLALERRRRFDWRAVARLAAWIREREIEIVHAHSTSVFLAAAACRRARRAKIVWHDHYGRFATKPRLVLPYQLIAPFLAGVIAVTPELADWSRRRLAIRAGRVRYIPNFAAESGSAPRPLELPGAAANRIALLANLRPQKDHPTMLRAMASIRERAPEAHLVLIGGGGERGYADSLRRLAADLGLEDCVTFLGEREDAGAVLRQCGVGVLSSAGEGFPLALLEYGLAGLPAVATAVGQCPEVLDRGRCGLLVPPRVAEPLARAVLSLLRSSERKQALAEKLQNRVRRCYSAEAVLGCICRFYEEVLASPGFR